MLTLATATPTSGRLNRLASAPVSTVDDIDWQTPIDRRRWFLCETLTPLYYTRIYHDLSLDHRRRYNQLTGMLANELIALLETELLDVALGAVERSAALDREMRAALARFRQDEERHAHIWERLNQLSEPGWYGARRRQFVRLPGWLARVARIVAAYPMAFPVLFWLQLAQEERSIEISRRCARVPRDTIEPRYAAVYRSHLRDESRHVQIDRHLIERFYSWRSPAVRWTTARVFRTVVSRFLLTPASSSIAVVRRLASEHPELEPLVPRMSRELRLLTASDEYHRMMYSRQTTPVTFGLFDRFEEFHQMQSVLRAYQPRTRSRA